MTTQIRRLDFDNDEEVYVAASFSMLTLLESLPEARRKPDSVPNFSIEEMAKMYRGGRHHPDHRYYVAEAEGGLIVGHAIALMRTEEDGTRYGYSYTRYILPTHRRQGLARRLLREAKGWWRSQGAAHVLAHTHTSNAPLLALFESEGFSVVERRDGRWPSLQLRCPNGALA